MTSDKIFAGAVLIFFFTHSSVPSSPPFCLPLSLPNSSSTLALRVINQRAKGTAGAKVVSIAADYWFINRTGLPLLFQAQDASGYVPGTPPEDNDEELRRSQPLLVSFASFNAGRGGGVGGSGSGSRSTALAASGGVVSPTSPSARCFVRVGPFSDKQPMAIDVSGTEGSLEPIQMRTREGMPLGRFYTLGVEVSRGSGRFSRTKMVVLVPSFVLINASNRDLIFRQEGVSAENSTFSLPCGTKQAFHWPSLRARQRLMARFIDSSGVLWEWTQTFPLAELGTYHIKLYRRRTSTAHLVRVDIYTKGATREVVFSDADSCPPFRLENHSLVPLVYHQMGCSSVFELKPGCSAAYAWDSLSKPLVLRVRERFSPDHSAAQYELQRLGDGPRLRYPQYFYIRSACGLVLGAAPRHSSEPTYVQACLDEPKPHDPHQLWRFNSDGRLVNNAGYQLEATTRGIGNSQVLLRRTTQEPPGPRECWKFEQGRLLTQHISVRTTSSQGLTGAPYALHIISPGRSPQVGDALVVSVAPTTKLMSEQVNYCAHFSVVLQYLWVLSLNV